MIERHWKGIIRFGEAENYISHLKNDTFVKLNTLNGFVSARILKRELAAGTEFLIITSWNSIDHIKAFAGDDITVAVVPKIASDMMVRFDNTVAHYEVL